MILQQQQQLYKPAALSPIFSVTQRPHQGPSRAPRTSLTLSGPADSWQCRPPTPSPSEGKAGPKLCLRAGSEPGSLEPTLSCRVPPQPAATPQCCQPWPLGIHGCCSMLTPWSLSLGCTHLLLSSNLCWQFLNSFFFNLD